MSDDAAYERAKAMEPLVRDAIARVLALKAGWRGMDAADHGTALAQIDVTLRRLPQPVDDAGRASRAKVSDALSAVIVRIGAANAEATDRALYALEYALGGLLPRVTGTLKLPLNVAQSMGIGTQPQELITYTIGAPPEAA